MGNGPLEGNGSELENVNCKDPQVAQNLEKYLNFKDTWKDGRICIFDMDQDLEVCGLRIRHSPIGSSILARFPTPIQFIANFNMEMTLNKEIVIAKLELDITKSTIEDYLAFDDPQIPNHGVTVAHILAELACT